VDPIALNIPTYLTVITQPRSLSTIKSNLATNRSYTPDLFDRDMQLIVDNAVLFNGKENPVGLAALALERYWRGLTKDEAGASGGGRKRKDEGGGARSGGEKKSRH
jgi:hypothetical protein